MNADVAAAQQRAARIVGYTYLLAILTAALAEFVLRPSVVQLGEAARTAETIVANERLFRLAAASDLATFVIDAVLIVALYVVLRPVSPNLAMLAVLWRAIETAVLVVVTLDDFAVVRILSAADYLRAFGSDQLITLSRLELGAHGPGYTVAGVFFGLGSSVFAYLWLRSRYVPAPLALLGLGASLLVAVVTFALLIFPELSPTLSPAYQVPIAAFEVAIGAWLVVRGLTVTQTHAA